jgi:restriction modification system DNA specificity subunit
MSEWPMVKLKELMRKTKSIDPGKYPDEEFALYSIPAYDNGIPEKIFGRDIGSSKILLKDSDVVLSKIVPHIRRTWVITDGEKQIGSSEWIVFNDDRFDPQFIANYLKSDVFHYQLLTTVAGVGGSLNRARPAAVAELKIPLPPLGEQKRIAEILGRVAEAEQHVQDTLELLDEVAKSSFYTFCGIPDHFERRKKIGEIAIVATGNTPPRKDPSNYGSYIEWIKSDNLGSIFPTPASEFLSEEGLKRGRVAAPGSLLMTCIAGSIKSIGKCSVVNRKVAFNQQINSIKPVDNEDLYYLYLLFYVAPYLVQRRSTGGLKGIVKKSSLEMCEIPWPERKVRQMIGTFCQEWINCHLLVMRKLSLLQELQKSLATRAFAGLL